MKKYYLILILLTALILRLVNLNQSLWLDEAAQALESVRPLSEQLNIVADFHPPLYHLFLHFWMAAGKSEIWLRIPSVILGVGCVLLIIKIAQKLGFKDSSNLTGFLLALSPLAIWYSQEVRPYMFFTFFSLLSTYLLLQKRWDWYISSSILAMYSNYFGIFLFLSQLSFIILADRRSLRNLIFSLIIVGTSFLPWLPSFLDQLKVGTGGAFQGWTEVVSLATTKVIPLTLAKFIFGRGSIDDNLLYFLILSPVLIIFLHSCLVLIKEKKNWGLLVLFFVPLLTVTFLTSIIPVAAPQRLLFILPYFIFILAIGVEKLPQKVKYFCIVLILATFLGGLLQYHIDPKVQREKWREAVDFIESTGDSRSIALFVFPTPFAPWQWYQNNIIAGKGIAPAFLVRDEDLLNPEKILNDKKRIFLFQYLSGLTDPEGKTMAKLEDLGYRQANIKNFAGVGFIYVLEKHL